MKKDLLLKRSPDRNVKRRTKPFAMNSGNPMLNKAFIADASNLENDKK
jgi:hypothetical protein